MLSNLQDRYETLGFAFLSLTLATENLLCSDLHSCLLSASQPAS
jgi:hypothetical protein